MKQNIESTEEHVTYTEGQKKRYITFYVISTCSRTVMEIRDSVQKHQPN